MSRPPAEPNGKDLISPTMSFSDISKSSGRLAAGGAGCVNQGRVAGCVNQGRVAGCVNQGRVAGV